MMTRADVDESCLGDDTLLDFVAGRLPSDRREVVERHLEACTLCTRLVSAAEGSARETVSARHHTRTMAPRTGGQTGDADDLTDRLPSKTPTLAPGTLLAETYRIVRLIGSGGMGEVYEAAHTRLTGRYAVKVLHHHWAGDPRAIVRFGREAQITSGLRHPNIVAIIDFDYTPAGSPYLVMEFIEGVELATVIANQAPLQPDRVVRIVDQIASALTAVHARNIVHRDLKPQNIFLVPGERPGDERVKLVDFGISKVRAASVVLTGERAVLGTPQYMARAGGDRVRDADRAHGVPRRSHGDRRLPHLARGAAAAGPGLGPGAGVGDHARPVQGSGQAFCHQRRVRRGAAGGGGERSPGAHADVGIARHAAAGGIAERAAAAGAGDARAPRRPSLDGGGRPGRGCGAGGRAGGAAVAADGAARRDGARGDADQRFAPGIATGGR